MRKTEVIREVREVMSGNSGHTVIAFGKNESGKWETFSTITNLSRSDFSEWEWVQIQKHNCNEISIKETTEIVNEAERFFG